MKILLVEDDISLAQPLLEALILKGIEGELVTDGRAGLERAIGPGFDVVVLDIGLPGMDGLEVLRRLREGGSRVPVLLLTSRDTTEDIVRGLDLGADEYLPKPFRVEELRARLEALYRRARREGERVLTRGILRLDLADGRVTIGDRSVRLTRTEGGVLRALLMAQGATVSKESLLEEVWGITFDPATNLLATCMARLRGKLESGGEARIIHTVPTVGYRLE